ncbi:glutamate decarboxylase [Aspergillus crustosus]
MGPLRLNKLRGTPDDRTCYTSGASTIIEQNSLTTLASIAPPDTPRPLAEVITQACEIFSSRASVNHRRFFSYIPSPVSPLSFLGDVLTSCFNVFSGSFEAGPGITAVELSLVTWLAEKIGLRASTAGGIFVSGGSMANLTALIVARDQKLNENERAKGVVYISTQTHFCIPKALRIIGFLSSQIRIIPCDGEFRMDVYELQKQIMQDLSVGLRPFLVVATCGSTGTGSIDPLGSISGLASEHNLWMHVDGSFGVSAALSTAHRHLVNGLARADSIAWDAHKWLFQTYGCGVVLVKEKRHLRASFASTAEFMQDIDSIVEDDKPNLWNYGVELTRPARHMRLWFSLQVLGANVLGDMIDRGFKLAEGAAREIRMLDGWEVVAPARMAILNARYSIKGKSEEELNAINASVPGRLIERNVAAISTTRFGDRVALRFCMINPLTTDEDVREFVKEMNAAVKELAKDGPISNGHRML